jgi:YgiT-type zinc finger domain-containing protein
MRITRCPTCGSDRIKKVRRNWNGEFRGKTYQVEGLEFHACPNCGEHVFDREAMRMIEARSPAFLAGKAEQTA